MSYKLSRRQFGQLAIIGTVTSGLTYLASKTLAATPTIASLNIIGISSGTITTTDRTVLSEINTIELDSTGAVDSFVTASIPVGLVLDALNPGTNLFKNLPTLGLLADKSGALLQTNEALTGFTFLNDGTLVLAITPVSNDQNGATPTRITLLSRSLRTLSVSGLKKNEQLTSVLGTNDGRLIGLVGKKNGTPPIKLVDVDVQTGQIRLIDKFKLPQNQRMSNLAQCPDGLLYTVIMGENGETTLVRLNPQQKNPIVLAQLKLNNQVWNNGLESLLCSTTGQLIAFGAMRYATPNSLYSVDINSGNMTFLQNFDSSRVTLVPN